MSKQDRQGARTVSDLERKYAFKKSFSAVMGIASDSQNTASEAKQTATKASEAVENLDSELDQLEVYNRLTKKGAAKALRLDNMGDLHISAEYIEGTLTQKNAPTNSTDVANKQYVDEQAQSGSSVAHSWQGTVLTITSASGTSSANLQGPKGDKGATGAQGPKGDTGPQGATGATGANGEKGDKGDPFTYSDFTSAQLAALKGDKGDKGDTGEQGLQGEKGDKGDKGDAGANGSDANVTSENIKNALGYTPAAEGDYALKSEIPTSLPASDVYAWAKASTKPKYTAAEVGALPSTTVIPNVGSGTDYTTYRARSIALKTTAETPPNGCLLGVY